jgi:hypothetical protein
MAGETVATNSTGEESMFGVWGDGYEEYREDMARGEPKHAWELSRKLESEHTRRNAFLFNNNNMLSTLFTVPSDGKITGLKEVTNMLLEMIRYYNELSGLVQQGKLPKQYLRTFITSMHKHFCTQGRPLAILFKSPHFQNVDQIVDVENKVDIRGLIRAHIVTEQDLRLWKTGSPAAKQLLQEMQEGKIVPDPLP